MARGGYRVGGGRKPGAGKGVVLGMDGGRRGTPGPVTVGPAADAPPDPLLESPADLSVEAQSVWLKWAALALAERTLTPATAAGFRELCQQSGLLAVTLARIQLLGPASKEADPYLKTYIKLAQRLDGSLARFKLTAFGKPATSDKPKAAANIWAQVVGK